MEIALSHLDDRHPALNEYDESLHALSAEHQLLPVPAVEARRRVESDTMKISPIAMYASLSGALLIAALASTAGAQAQLWSRQFGTFGSEYATSSAPDGAGGIYLSGGANSSLGGPSAGGGDAWLAHYDRAGGQTWIRQFGTTGEDWSQSAAPDGAGGVYLCGTTSVNTGGPNGWFSEEWLAHYDGAGNQTLIRRFGTMGVFNLSAAEGAGGVYVCGAISGSAGQVDAWLARYDSMGSQVWSRQLGTLDDDRAHVAAPDGSGGVYVGGTTSGSLGGPNAGAADVWLAHYDSAGNQTWIRQFGTMDPDGLRTAAYDGANGVFVSGATLGSFGGANAGGTDVWLAHYDSAGNQTWIRQLGTADLEYPSAAARDGSGGVYVSGVTEGSLGGPNAGGLDAWLAHYDGAGNRIRIQQFGTTGQDNVWAAADDGTAGCYLAGATTGSLGGPSAGGLDAWVARFDGLDSNRYCTPANSNSTGQPGVLAATGSNAIVANTLTVVASQLPQRAYGFFMTSMTQGFTAGPAGSQGNVCVAGTIGRFVGQGQILNAGAAGTVSLVLDLNTWPSLSTVVQPGETWNFQAWYRDANPGPTSNFTDAVAVTFR